MTVHSQIADHTHHHHCGQHPPVVDGVILVPQANTHWSRIHVHKLPEVQIFYAPAHLQMRAIFQQQIPQGEKEVEASCPKISHIFCLKQKICTCPCASVVPANAQMPCSD
jgi:hypothetical protein